MDLNIKFERGFIKPDRKSILFLVLIILLAVLVGMVLFNYFSKPEPEEIIDEDLFKQLRRQEIVKQLDELEASKEEIPPLSSEEIQNQLKELNSL